MTTDTGDQLTFSAQKAADPQRFYDSQKRGAAATIAYWQQPKPPAWLDCDAAEFERWLKQQEEANHV